MIEVPGGLGDPGDVDSAPNRVDYLELLPAVSVRDLLSSRDEDETTSAWCTVHDGGIELESEDFELWADCVPGIQPNELPEPGTRSAAPSPAHRHVPVASAPSAAVPVASAPSAAVPPPPRKSFGLQDPAAAIARLGSMFGSSSSSMLGFGPRRSRSAGGPESAAGGGGGLGARVREAAPPSDSELRYAAEQEASLRAQAEQQAEQWMAMMEQRERLRELASRESSNWGVGEMKAALRAAGDQEHILEKEELRLRTLGLVQIEKMREATAAAKDVASRWEAEEDKEDAADAAAAEAAAGLLQAIAAQAGGGECLGGVECCEVAWDSEAAAATVPMAPVAASVEEEVREAVEPTIMEVT